MHIASNSLSDVDIADAAAVVHACFFSAASPDLVDSCIEKVLSTECDFEIVHLHA